MESRKTRTSSRGGASGASQRRLGHAWLGVAWALLLANAPQAGAAPSEKFRAGMVTVRITGQEWNWKTPWSKQSPWTRTVTGLVVPGPAILVATPSIGNHLLIEAQKKGEDLRTTARLVLSDPEGPFALLAVDDAKFWQPAPTVGV